MHIAKLFALLSGVLLFSQTQAQAQYTFFLTFRGTCYQTNANGEVRTMPLTEQTFLQDAAQAGGITDLKSLALIYHIGGGGLGDTIEVVNATSGSLYKTLFGLYFGEDQSLGRIALTNAASSEVRRVDYIYTLESTTYTSPNSHSMGAAFTTKRFLTDALGNVRTAIDAQMQWLVVPQGGNGTKVCTGSFMTGKAFAP